jgi:hypothetical protein
LIEECNQLIEERRARIREQQKQKESKDAIIQEHMQAIKKLEEEMAGLTARIGSSKTEKEDREKMCRELVKVREESYNE